MRLLIHGSCVSRDALRFTTPKDHIELVDYYARTSFASLAGKSFDNPINLDILDSNFQKRMVMRDLTKSFLDDLPNLSFDMLLIDLIDERFQVIDGVNGALTVSTEFRKCVPQYAQLPGKLLKPRSFEFMERWNIGWSALVNKLNNHNLLGKVCINRVYWSYQTEQGHEYANHNRKEIESYNKMLDMMYERISRDIPESQIFKFPKNLLVGSSNHKWGESPFHYVDDYYRELISKIRRSKKELAKHDKP